VEPLGTSGNLGEPSENRKPSGNLGKPEELPGNPSGNCRGTRGTAGEASGIHRGTRGTAREASWARNNCLPSKFNWGTMQEYTKQRATIMCLNHNMIAVKECDHIPHFLAVSSATSEDGTGMPAGTLGTPAESARVGSARKRMSGPGL
jgi:hypothetical protein